MANLADTIISTSAMLGACLASIRAALAQTRDELHAAALKAPVDGRLSQRSDTLEMFFEPSLTTALSRRQELLGDFDGGFDND